MAYGKKQKKGKFPDWKLKDWLIYAGLILICLSLLYAAWNFIKTGRYFIGGLLFICFILLLPVCLIPIFSKQRPEVEQKLTPLTVSIPKTKEKFIELAKSIGVNDEVLEEISACIDEPESFLEELGKVVKEGKSNADEKLYEDLSAEYDEYKAYAKNSKVPFFQGALILLDYRGMVARFDWKGDRETFVFLMENLTMAKTNGLTIDENAFSKFEDVGQFCGQLDKHWKKAGYHTVLIDNDSDEYIVGIQKN